MRSDGNKFSHVCCFSISVSQGKNRCQSEGPLSFETRCVEHSWFIVQYDKSSYYDQQMALSTCSPSSSCSTTVCNIFNYLLHYSAGIHIISISIPMAGRIYEFGFRTSWYFNNVRVNNCELPICAEIEVICWRKLTSFDNYGTNSRGNVAICRFCKSVFKNNIKMSSSLILAVNTQCL
jgi:hypothetical protein